MHDCLLVTIVMAFIIESFLTTYYIEREEAPHNVELYVVCLHFFVYRMLALFLPSQSIIHNIKKRAITRAHPIVQV